jgi:hypothetical protein
LLEEGRRLDSSDRQIREMKVRRTVPGSSGFGDIDATRR